MGSTGIHLERGTKAVDAIFRDLDPALTVLEHRTRRTSGEWQHVTYAAIRNGKTDEVFGLVVLTHRNPSPHVYWNFTYKYVDETMGPTESDCPAVILDLLTETDSEYAIEWRARCRRSIENPPPRVTVGDVIDFGHALNFGDGAAESRFTFVGRTTFRRQGDGRLVRIPNWRLNYRWTVAA